MSISMSTTEKLQEVLKKAPVRDATTEKFAEMYQNLLQMGIIKKKGYDLPQLDTVGRELVKLESHAKGKN